MQGQSDVGVSNHIGSTWTPAQTIEAGEAVRSLREHPGWVIVMELVDWACDGQLDQVINAKVPLDQSEYAMRLGRVRGASLTADIVATVIAHAEQAVQLAHEVAALDAAVEGS